MVGNLPQSGVELVIETGRYDRGIKTAITGADRADRALDTLVSSADRANRALNSIDSDINVDVDMAVDDTAIRNAQGLIDDLSQTEDISIGVDDSRVKTAQGAIDNLSQTEDVDIDVDTKEAESALANIQKQLELIKTLSVINLAITGAEMLTNIEELPVVSSLLEMDSAIRTINARTLGEIPNAAAVVNDLYTNAWGESREEIANLIVEMNRLGIANADLAATGEDVFQVAAATGEDPTELLRRMDTLVKNGLVPSFSEAGDVIVGAFNSGLNRGDDFLETIDEYSQVVSDTGLSFNTWFEIMRAGLGEGVRDTDKLADAYKEMLNLTREETTRNASFGEETDRTVALEEIGLFDEAEAYAAGELAADEFVAALQDGLAAVADPAKQRELALAIFSPTMVEDAGLPGLLAANLSDSPDVVEAFRGIAEESANILNDSLSTAFTEASRTLETALTEALSIPLTDFLDRLKGAAQTFADELQAGSSVTDAAAVALQIDPDSLARLESIIGNIGIAILQGMAGLLDFVGQGDAADALRASVEDMARTQLQFDIGLADDGASLEQAIKSAAARGVSNPEIGASIADALNEAIGSGDLITANRIVGSIAGAGLDFDTSGYEAQIAEQTAVIAERFNTALANQDLLTAADLAISTGDTTLLSAGIDAALAAEQPVLAQTLKDALAEFVDGTDQYVQPEIDRLNATLQNRFDNALTMGDFNLAKTIAEQSQDPEQLAAIEAWTDQLMATVQSGLESGGENLAAAESAAAMLGDPALYEEVRVALDATAAEYATMSESAGQSMTTVEADTVTMRTTVDSENSAIRNTLDGQKSAWKTWAETAVLWIDKIGERIVYVEGALNGFNNNLTIPGVNNAPVPQAAGGGTFGAGQMVETGHGGVELITMPREGSIINAANSSQLMEAISAVTGLGGGGGNVTNNYVTINASQNMQTQSQGQAAAAGSAFYRSLMGYGQQ